MATVGVLSGNDNIVELVSEGEGGNLVMIGSAQSSGVVVEEEAVVLPEPGGELLKEDSGKSAGVGDAEPTTTSEELETVTQDATSTADKKSVQGESETTVALIEGLEQADDDIIVLDDEQEKANESGASDSKRPRKDEEDDDDDIMEVDENGVITKEEKESVGKVIRRMKRKDLEDLVLAKIVEGLVSHTEVGQLRGRVLELQMQKDKMASKMAIMMKQVAELSRAIKGIAENELRDPSNRINKQHTIKFNRSVGLQAVIEPSVRTTPPTILRVPESVQTSRKLYTGAGTNAGKGATTGAPTYNKPNSQPVKRPYQGTKTGGDNKPTANQVVTSTTSPRKVYSSPQAPVAGRLPPPPPVYSRTNANTPQVSQSGQSGIVDLTDDDQPTPRNSTGMAPPSSTVTNAPVGGTTKVINGVQYHVISSYTPTNVQFVPPPGQRYIAAGAQPRPVMLNQFGARQQVPTNQPLRGATNNTPVTVIPQRQVMMTRAPNMGATANVNHSRVAAMIPTRPATGSVLGPNSNIQREFVLPPLPPTPPPKVRNDTIMPPQRPELSLTDQCGGIVLSWNLPSPSTANVAEATTYQLFACQENINMSTSNNKPPQWKKIGDVKSLPLPMACTLSQFTEENRYHFIVRGVDAFGRVGPFCEPKNIVLRLRK